METEKKKVVRRPPQPKQPATRASLEAEKRRIEKEMKLLQLKLQAIDIEIEFLPANSGNGTA